MKPSSIEHAQTSATPGQGLPQALAAVLNKPIIALIISADRPIQMRRSRLVAPKKDREITRDDSKAVRTEIIEVRRMFERHNWSIIDIIFRSVEETAAQIINILAADRGGVAT